MRRNRTIVHKVMASCLMLMIDPPGISARASFADDPQAKQLAPLDRSRVLIRREAEAERRRGEADFERLRKLPPAPAGEALPVRVVRARGGVRIARVGGLWLRLEPEPVRGEDEDLGDGLAGQQDNAGRREQRALVPASYFDDLVFGGGQEENIRDALVQALKRRIRYLKEGYALTPAQEQKLLLAGKGDLKRLFDEIANERQNFEQARADEDRLREFLRDIAPLRFRLSANVFDGPSLFSKTLQKMYADKQLSRKNVRTGASQAVYAR